MTVFLFPGSVSLGPRGGGTVAGTGVIPIIGVIPITPTITLAIIPTIEIPLTEPESEFAGLQWVPVTGSIDGDLFRTLRKLTASMPCRPLPES